MQPCRRAVLGWVIVGLSFCSIVGLGDFVYFSLLVLAMKLAVYGWNLDTSHLGFLAG